MNVIQEKLNREFNKFALHHKPNYFDPLVKEVENNYEVRNSVIFEFGCGSGEFLLSFYDSGVRELIGMDISAPSITQALSRKKDKKNIYFLNQDILKEQWRYSTPNLILSHSVFQYIYDLEPVLKKLYGILAPGGNIFATIEKKNQINPINLIQWFNFILAPEVLKRNFYHFLKPIIYLLGKKEVRDKCENKIASSKARYLAIPVVQFVSKRRLKDLFSRVGFKNITIEKALFLDKMSAPHYLIKAEK